MRYAIAAFHVAGPSLPTPTTAPLPGRLQHDDCRCSSAALSDTLTWARRRCLTVREALW
jgi:hypothetical protein